MEIYCPNYSRTCSELIYNSFVLLSSLIVSGGPLLSSTDTPFQVFLRQTNVTPRLTPWWSRALKRVFDICVSLIVLVALAPLFGYLALRIKRDSPGPVFYRGLRMGFRGRPFRILKFRTMRENPESYTGPRVTAQDDTRITHFGHWLRKSKMNELPQFWNVLIGEMSLVGPRPEDPEIVKTWAPEICTEVLSVRPGITSPASVIYRDEESLLQSSHVMETYLDSILPSKLRLDQLYVRHRSFLLDLDVLFWTALIVLPRPEVMPSEDFLFLGPFSRLVGRYLNPFIIDALVTLIAFGASGVFWRLSEPLDIGWSKAILLSIGMSLLFSITGALLGINRIEWSKSRALDSLDLLVPVGLATLIALVVDLLLLPVPALPPRVVIVAAPLAYVGYVVTRYRTRLISGLASRWLRTRSQATTIQERVLIVGSGDSGHLIAWLLHTRRDANVFRVVGFVDDDLYKQGRRIEGNIVLGRRDDIAKLVQQHDVGIIIFAIHNIDPDEHQEILKICLDTPAQVVMLPDMLAILKQALRQDGDPLNDLSEQDWNLSKQAVQADAWLAELDVLAQAGDLETLRSRIKQLRQKFQ